MNDARSDGSHSSGERPDLVEKRLRYIARAKAAKPGTVDVRLAGWRPLGTGPTNRHGMPRLPTGQREVTNWPVLDLADVLKIALDRGRLVIGGVLAKRVTLTCSVFLSLRQVEDTCEVHCVTTWSLMDNRWKGVGFTTL